MAGNVEETRRPGDFRLPNTSAGERRAARAHRLCASLAALALVTAVFAQGCGSSSSSPVGRATPAGSTVPPVAAAPGAFPTIPSMAQPQTVTGPQNAYTIEIPAGWQGTDLTMPGGFARRYGSLQGSVQGPQVTVRCAPGETIDALSTEDQHIVGNARGAYGVGGFTAVTVAGLRGKQTNYTIPLSGVAIGSGGAVVEARVVYLQGTSCAWQFLLQAFGTGQAQRYSGLFNQVLATFRPATPGG